MSYKFYKTIDANLYDLNVFYENDLYDKATNFGELLTNKSSILDDFIQYHKSLVSFDPIQSQSNIFKQLDSNSLSNYNEIQFKVFWYERYLSSITPVKERFLATITNPIIFKDISDSIGCLRNVEYLPDDTILSIFDIDFNLSTDNIVDQLVPVNYATTIQNKISNNSKIMTSYMSRFCTSMYRHNMYQLGVPFSDSKSSHGSNLVADYYHYDRIYNIAKQTLETELTKFYEALYDIITFYENYQCQDYDNDNLQFKDKGAIAWTLDGLQKTTDYLKQEVGFYKNIAKTATILGSID
jgi:hypothetical protein